jgi:hypothetical protein
MARVRARPGASNASSDHESEHETPAKRPGPPPPQRRGRHRHVIVNNQPLGLHRLEPSAPHSARAPPDDPTDGFVHQRRRRAQAATATQHCPHAQPTQERKTPPRTAPAIGPNYYAPLADHPQDSTPIRPNTQSTNNTGSAKRKYSSSASATGSDHGQSRAKHRRGSTRPKGRKRIQHPTIESSILPPPRRPKFTLGGLQGLTAEEFATISAQAAAIDNLPPTVNNNIQATTAPRSRSPSSRPTPTTAGSSPTPPTPDQTLHYTTRAEPATAPTPAASDGNLSPSASTELAHTAPSEAVDELPSTTRGDTAAPEPPRSPQPCSSPSPPLPPATHGGTSHTPSCTPSHAGGPHHTTGGHTHIPNLDTGPIPPCQECSPQHNAYLEQGVVLFQNDTDARSRRVRVADPENPHPTGPKEATVSHFDHHLGCYFVYFARRGRLHIFSPDCLTWLDGPAPSMRPPTIHPDAVVLEPLHAFTPPVLPPPPPSPPPSPPPHAAHPEPKRRRIIPQHDGVGDSPPASPTHDDATASPALHHSPSDPAHTPHFDTTGGDSADSTAPSGSHTQFADSDFPGLSEKEEDSPSPPPPNNNPVEDAATGLLIVPAEPTGEQTPTSKRYAIIVYIRTDEYQICARLPSADGGKLYTLAVPGAGAEHLAGNKVRIQFNAPLTEIERRGHQYACQVPSCNATPPDSVLAQGVATQRQWLAGHYRSQHAPGTLSPAQLGPADLASCPHCHSVYTRSGVGRHADNCESRPSAATPRPQANSKATDTDPFSDDALEFLTHLDLDGPAFQHCAGHSMIHPPKGAQIHINACYDALFSRLAHNMDDTRLWKVFAALPTMLFAPFPHAAKTARTPESHASIMRRRCQSFLQGDLETLWGAHTWTTPAPSPRTAQFAHKELSDTIRGLVQDGSLSRAASRLFSSGLAPASSATVELLLRKCPAATPHDFPDHADEHLPQGDTSTTSPLGSAVPPNISPAQRERVHKSWKATLATLPSGSAPGGDGWRYEHLKHALDASPSFPFILQAIQEQAIPNTVRHFLAIPRLLAFLKPDPNDASPPSLIHGIRPIGIPSALRRVATKPLATDATKRWSKRLRKAGQHGSGLSAGVEAVPRALQLILEHNPSYAIVSEDCYNAFNELLRAVIVEVLEKEDPALLQQFIAYYQKEVPQFFRLANGSLHHVPSQRGGIQGDALFSIIFDIVYTVRVLEPLANEFKDKQISVYAVHDDTYLVGPAAHLAAASKRLRELAAACGLKYGDAKRKLYQHPLPPRPPGLTETEPADPSSSADPAGPPPPRPSTPRPHTASVPSLDIADYLRHFPSGAAVVRTCFKAGGVPVGLDRPAVRTWCNNKAGTYGLYVKKLVSLDIGAQNRFALLYYCGRPTAKLNHHFRIIPPSLTAEAADAADAHIAAAVAAITHTPAALYQPGQHLALRARLHAPVAASSPTASDGGGAGFASIRDIAPAAYLAGFIDTLPHLAAGDATAAYVSDPTSFSSSPSPALQEVAAHFCNITSNQFFPALAEDWRTQHIHHAITDDPTSDSTTRLPNIALLPKAAGRHAQRPFSLVLQRSATVALTRSSTLPLDVKCSISQSSQHGAGLFLSSVPATPDLRLTDKEFLVNYWHRFGLIGELGVLVGKTCTATCRLFPPGRARDITGAFLSGAHSLSCSCCGTLQRHNAILKGPIAANLNKQGYNVVTKHLVLDSFGKKAVDAYVSNPYADEPKTVLDLTISCPACPSYIKNAAATNNDYCTKSAECAKHSKYDDLAKKVNCRFLPAAFTTYGGWGAEFKEAFVDPYYKKEFKAARKNGESGWAIINDRLRYERLVAAALCRENARMLASTLDARSRARATHRSARPRSFVADSAADS